MNWLNCCVKGILPASKAASTEAALSMILVVLVQWETFTSFFYTQLDEWQADDVMLSLTCLCIMSVPPLLFLELVCNLEDSQHIYMLLKDMMSEWTLLRGCKALTTNSDTKAISNLAIYLFTSPHFLTFCPISAWFQQVKIWPADARGIKQKTGGPYIAKGPQG